MPMYPAQSGFQRFRSTKVSSTFPPVATALPVNRDAVAFRNRNPWTASLDTTGLGVPSGHAPTSYNDRPPAPSTRSEEHTNSSHTVISYAVFCLKKKKKHQSHHQQ